MTRAIGVFRAKRGGGGFGYTACLGVGVLLVAGLSPLCAGEMIFRFGLFYRFFLAGVIRALTAPSVSH
jgi:hypothetical protein